MAPKIALIDKTHPILIERLSKLGYECIPAHEPSLEAIWPRLPDYEGIIIRSRFTLDKAFLEQCSKLKFIARMGIGLEHIDLDFAAEKGIRVFNSPEGSRDSVGEHTVGLILGLLHRLQRSNLQIRRGIWDRKTNKGLELRHRTVGIIGFGNTGSAVAQRLQCFGCKILAYDKYKKGFAKDHVQEVSLERLQAAADIVTIHIPYDQHNHYFVNTDMIDGFQKPIFLINTARGLVLNTADLVRALQNGKVLGAALDVLEYEEQAFNVLELESLPAPFQYLRESEDVILTPHIAGISAEVMEAHARVLGEKVGAWKSE
jgi:D-3-phosphoglycerate dehydrogenase